MCLTRRDPAPLSVPDARRRKAVTRLLYNGAFLQHAVPTGSPARPAHTRWRARRFQRRPRAGGARCVQQNRSPCSPPARPTARGWSRRSRFFAPALRVHLLPDWETLPYDSFSPHQDLVSERLATLYQISHQACDVIVVPVTTALYRLPPVEFLAGYSFFLKQGETISPDALRKQLILAGYQHVTQVVSPGEFSFRGGLIDLFPMGSALPYRVDLLDNEVDSIRTFDVDTQRSIYKVKDVRLLPAREFPTDEDARTRFRQSFREKFEGDPSRSQLYKDVSNGVFAAGIEYYLPLFFEQTAVVTDYLPEDTLVCLHGDLTEAIEQLLARHALALRSAARRPRPPAAAAGRAVPQPGSVLRRGEAVCAARDPAPGADAQQARLRRRARLPALQVDRRADNPLHRLRDFLDGFARPRADRRRNAGPARDPVAVSAPNTVCGRRLRRLRRLPGRDRAADADGGPARQWVRRRRQRRRRARLHHRERALRRPGALARPARGDEPAGRRELPARPLRAQGGRPGGAHAATASAATSASSTWTSARA